MQRCSFTSEPCHSKVCAVFTAFEGDDFIDRVLSMHSGEAGATSRDVVGAGCIPNIDGLTALMQSNRQNNLYSFLEFHMPFTERMRQTRSTSLRSRSLILVNSAP